MLNNELKTVEKQPSADNRQRRRLSGVVVSMKMAKTMVVRVDRRVAHPKYEKYFTVSKRYKVHDDKREAKVGDVVEIEETRPISKEKHWRYCRIVKAV
jgi:small subunit ribosomal protein S17